MDQFVVRETNLIFYRFLSQFQVSGGRNLVAKTGLDTDKMDIALLSSLLKVVKVCSRKLNSNLFIGESRAQKRYGREK